MLQAVLAAAGAGALLAYYYYKRATRVLLPLTLEDCRGHKVKIRLAVAEDRTQVAESIADHSGTGSGTGGDMFLLQEFERMVTDPHVSLLFVDDENGKGLGMMAVVWSSSTESYWQSLRVAEAGRGRGVAKLLFNVAARLAIERQGRDSVSRWGVVSNNAIMTDWSTRMKLHGPQVFRRHAAPASTEPPALPAGYTLREATMADVPAIMAALPTFPIAQSDFGTQNFVQSGWANFSEAALLNAIRGEESRGIPMPCPRLLHNAAGELIAFAAVAVLRFGEATYFMNRHMDGTPEGFNLLVHCLPSLAHRYDCGGTGGYVPTLPFVLETFERSSVYKRATATEQWEYHWKNVDYA